MTDINFMFDTRAHEKNKQCSYFRRKGKQIEYITLKIEVEITIIRVVNEFWRIMLVTLDGISTSPVWRR
jgi:hypothetical protein